MENLKCNYGGCSVEPYSKVTWGPDSNQQGYFCEPHASKLYDSVKPHLLFNTGSKLVWIQEEIARGEKASEGSEAKNSRTTPPG